MEEQASEMRQEKRMEKETGNVSVVPKVNRLGPFVVPVAFGSLAPGQMAQFSRVE